MSTTSISAAGSTPPSRRREADPAGDPPFDSAIRAGSYARFSSSLQSEKSNADQQRECREMAQRNGHRILPELEFVDEAVSGTKRERTGLNALLAAAENGELHVLYFHSLSRLSRESVITLPLLKSLVHKHDVRVISVADNIDSDNTGWELLAHLMAIVHEHYIKDLAANVLRGQEGTLLEGFSVGDGCFGYTSAPVAESETGRRGRNAKPHKIYVIDPDHAAWVKRIFHWFVVERRSLRWITRELNRLGAPKDHRATTDSWRHQYLPRLLRNRKYTGQWPWGEKRNVRDPLTGKVSQKDRKPEECESWVRDFPHLRLIDDATFAEADRLLTENEKRYKGHRKAKGTLRGAKSRAAHQHPRHLLSGLIRCRECGSTLNVGGSGGKYLFCPTYAQGNCTCKTQLRRDLAERMILDEIGRRILRDPVWREAVLDATRKCWKQQEAQLPSELAAATKALADIEQKIAKLVDGVENGTDEPEIAARLRKRRAEKKQLRARVERLRRTNDDRRPEPTEAWVNEQLDNLGTVLTEKTPAAAHALRELVGGAIVVTEIREPGRKRHYLRGRFTITTKALVAGLMGRDEAGEKDSRPVPSDITETIVIDFREPPEIDALSVRAKELYDQGLLNAQIAKELGRAPSYVTKLLKHWFASHGQEMPDGHARRATFSILVIFLCVAALYESWTIPIVNLLMLPLGVFGALMATWMRGLSNDVYFQIGFLTTLGLSTKNAILIVQFIKEQQRQGKGLTEATLAAVRIRFRPVIMTSLAFFFGTLPLALAGGAGAGAMNAIGTAVTGGMISATFIDLIFIPLFFVLISSIFSKQSKEEPVTVPVPAGG